MRNYLFALCLLTLIASCTNEKKEIASIKEDDFLWQYMDSTVKPGDDFFKYATGSWMKNNPIPSSERRWGIGNLVKNDIYDQIRKINDESGCVNPSTLGHTAMFMKNSSKKF